MARSGGGGLSLEISAAGLRRLRKTLATIEPIAGKEFTKALQAPMKRVQSDAKGMVRVSRTGELRRGIRFGAYRQTRKKTFGGYKVWQDTPQGNIIEYAGSVNGQGARGSRSGAQLIKTLDAQYGSTSSGLRLIWRAYEKNKTDLDKAIKKAIREAERQIEQGGLSVVRNRNPGGR